jgi:hypothetical protein
MKLHLFKFFIHQQVHFLFKLRTLKFTSKLTLKLLLHVSVYDHHLGACIWAWVSYTVIFYWQVTFSIKTSVLLFVLLLVYRKGLSHLKGFCVCVTDNFYTLRVLASVTSLSSPFSTNLPHASLEKLSCWGWKLIWTQNVVDMSLKTLPAKRERMTKNFPTYFQDTWSFQRVPGWNMT